MKRQQPLALCDRRVMTDKVNVGKTLKEEVWRRQPFSKVSNVFLLNPTNNIVELLRYSTVGVKVHVVYTEKYKGSINIDYDVDTAIVHESLSLSFNSLRRIDTFKRTGDLLEIIKKIILIDDKKNIDLLMPITPCVPYVNDIDILNESDVDVFVKLNKVCSEAVSNFTELADVLSNSCEYMLARESICKRYSYSISNRNYNDFIALAAKDGCRFSVVER
ncbi:hypothetical protein GCM10023116_23800 [Kistimonas scapharcae]|uniref:Uncharacterized protein n=2 Tax=Kistimonas scapharcae TaxID=1036133 RepID=A0ABP8V2I5_9GAMM